MSNSSCLQRINTRTLLTGKEDINQIIGNAAKCDPSFKRGIKGFLIFYIHI